MVQGKSPSKRSWRESVKPPLVFSAVLGVVAAVVTLLSASGGSHGVMRWDLAFLAFGIAFIASLLVCAMLMLADKPNPSALSEGSGVHRVSAQIPGGAANADKVSAANDVDSATSNPETTSTSPSSDTPGVPEPSNPSASTPPRPDQGPDSGEQPTSHGEAATN